MLDENKLLSDRQRIISALTAARIEKGLSQQALADMIGTKRSNICRLEAGGQNISLDTLLKISAALGKDVSFILNERNEEMDNDITNYSLRLYDDELLTFSFHKEGLAGLTAKIISVNENLKPLFPLDLDVTDAGIAKWLQGRIIPKNRTFVGEILAQFGLTIDDTKGIIDICKGLSLNDSYWVVPLGFDGKYADYNLYENRFSEVLSLVAYTGNAGSHEAFTTSPEFTTNGMLPKAWRYIEGDGIYLYKGGTSGGANTGKEPYSEYYAYQIAERMGLNAVYYDLENWKGILASKCKLFTDIDTAFVPTGRIVKSGGIAACLDFYETIGKQALEELEDIIDTDDLEKFSRRLNHLNKQTLLQMKRLLNKLKDCYIELLLSNEMEAADEIDITLIKNKLKTTQERIDFINLSESPVSMMDLISSSIWLATPSLYGFE